MDDPANELVRLRAIGAWMREIGATSYTAADGIRIDLDPLGPPVAKSAPVAANSDEEDIEGDERRAERETRELERRWREHWRRYTRSSGATVPPFPGPEKALILLGSH